MNTKIPRTGLFIVDAKKKLRMNIKNISDVHLMILVLLLASTILKKKTVHLKSQ